MTEKEVVQLIQHYRHDLMNHLQVIHGYASMGKVERVEEKTSDAIAYYHEERKLMQLQAFEFFLWVLQFHQMYQDMRLKFRIHTENKKVEKADKLLTEQCRQIMALVQDENQSNDLIDIELEMVTGRTEVIEVRLMIYGIINQESLLIRLNSLTSLYTLSVYKQANCLICDFSVPCF
ncbi:MULTISPECIES: Spo0B domain-containing protein [Virgibacillus]|uniref:SpoOB alpha-helical domain-containing protein n=2 Tax=Virgibacillus TaxID=84406 RepID=A0A024QB62_9BACI|nr:MULTISPECIES: Spo0B domain-containing protein [Virgibacillus]EQB35833.1 hypothetical protein M948_12400 [Virgibacillus sp. CM-4]MYL41636.1 hypothetical protein [Virgibacillus massiliensis]GGJ49272.1 hypothetical protein GCM10007111_09260 [Virgibacillus kapii]CDQ39445.1 hypothetical protein BN990_01747 [Virgibacillus massiliensis]